MIMNDLIKIQTNEDGAKAAQNTPAPAGAEAITRENYIKGLKGKTRLAAENGSFTIYDYATICKRKINPDAAVWLEKMLDWFSLENDFAIWAVEDVRGGCVKIYSEMVLKQVFAEFFSESHFEL